MTTFRDRWLHAESRHARNPAKLVSDRFYDLVVTTSSWDARCLPLTRCELRAQRSIAVFFENKGTRGRREKHDRAVRAYLKRISHEQIEIEQRSEATRELWADLWDGVRRSAAEAGRPLRVLFDISTCPRIYAMALVANCFRAHLAHSLTVLYAEGKYPPPSQEDPHELFTAGRWTTIPVPGLEGASDPSRRRHYVVSVGFEGSKTLRAVSTEDAETVSVLFPRPGVHAVYEQRTREENSMLFEEYGIGADETYDIAAGDAVAVWQRLTEVADRWNTDDLFYLPCGTKPHAIGMAMHALTTGRPSVMYAKPAAHKETETRPLGKYWAYELRDMTALAADRDR